MTVSGSTSILMILPVSKTMPYSSREHLSSNRRSELPEENCKETRRPSRKENRCSAERPETISLMKTRSTDTAAISLTFRKRYTEKRTVRFKKKKEEGYVIDRLKKINECFFNNDEEGINEILKEAEANTGLSKWNRLRIINECKTALLDVHITTNLKKHSKNS